MQRTDIEVGDGEPRLEVARRVVHVAGDRAGAQHQAERIDGPVVHDRTAVRIGLVHRLEHVVLPADDRQPGDGLGCVILRLRLAITRPPARRRAGSPR